MRIEFIRGGIYQELDGSSTGAGDGARVLGDFLAKHARDIPASEAIVFKNRRITYEVYHRESDRVAAGLLAAGIARGSRVGIYLSTRPEYLYIYMAAVKIGAIAVPVGRRFTPPEIRAIVNDAGISILFTMQGFGGMDFVKNVEQIRQEVPSLQRVVMLDDPSAYPSATPFDDFLRAPGPSMTKAASAVSPGDTALLIYTSGTTGAPKAAMITHGNIISYSRGMIRSTGVARGDSMLLNVPLNHVGGAVMAAMSCLSLGNRLAMMDSFIPEDALKIIEREKISIVGQVPAQYAIELLNPNVSRYDLRSVRVAIVSGQPCPADLIRRIRGGMGMQPRNAYGLTEAGGAITFTGPEQGEDKMMNTVGLPIDGIEIAVMDDLNGMLPNGQIGEIAVKGATVMPGYWNRPEENRLAFDALGYFRTGDMGMLDNDGFLVLSGRKNEMYIRGGETVYPPEVEEVITLHPAVLQVAVMGRPDPVMGEVGRAYIIPRPGATLTTEELKEFLSDKIARYKIPEDIIVRNNLPLTPIGKVKKLDLYEEIKREFKVK
jgi:acyl-CoA synthetase (AMP-forming)/AMP-acid ligase II